MKTQICGIKHGKFFIFSNFKDVKSLCMNDTKLRNNFFCFKI